MKEIDDVVQLVLFDGGPLVYQNYFYLAKKIENSLDLFYIFLFTDIGANVAVPDFLSNRIAIFNPWDFGRGLGEYNISKS